MELVYVLALVPAVLWGASPILSKRGMAAGGTALQAAIVVIAVDSVLFWTALFVRQGFDLFANITPSAAALFLGAGVVGTALGRLATYAGVDRVGASVNSAGISTRPLFASILAVIFLGEAATLATAAGVVVLVAGLVVLGLSEGGDVSGWTPTDLLFPISAAALFGVGNVVRKFGLDAFGGVTVLEAVALNETAALVVLLAYGVWAGRIDVGQAAPRTYLYFAGSGVLTAVALVSMFAALRLGKVIIVDPLGATAPLFTTVFAALFLRKLERVTKGVVAGAVLVVAGVVLITAL